MFNHLSVTNLIFPVIILGMVAEKPVFACNRQAAVMMNQSPRMIQTRVITIKHPVLHPRRIIGVNFREIFRRNPFTRRVISRTNTMSSMPTLMPSVHYSY